MCAYYGGARDISLFRSINKELFGKIVQTELDIFKKSIYETETNLYGESLNKVYFPGVRLACKIILEEQMSQYDENNMDIAQNAQFKFIRDELKEKDIYLEIGDIIHWNDAYWEIDGLSQSKYFMGRNPETNKTIGNYWGWNIGVNVTTHQTRKSLQQLEDVRNGNSRQNINYSEKDSLY